MTTFRWLTMLVLGVAAQGCMDVAPADGELATEAAPLVQASRHDGTTRPGGFVVVEDDDDEIDDIVVEDDGPGVLEDCTATAACGASCSVTGDGTCDTFDTYVACAYAIPCGKDGDQTCWVETVVDCLPE